MDTDAVFSREDKEKLSRTITELQQQIQGLQQGQQQPTTSQQYRPKVGTPDLFNGKKAGLFDYLSQLDLYFQLREFEFQNDSQRILFAGSFLRENAAAWFQALQLKRNNGKRVVPELEHWGTFVQSFKDSFGEIDHHNQVIRRIYKLKQTTAASDFAAQFQRMAAELSWEEEPLCALFMEGLKEPLQREIRARELQLPDTLQDFIRTAVKIDDLMFEKQQTDRKTYRPYQPFARNPSQIQNNAFARPAPPMAMELDATAPPRPKYRGNRSHTAAAATPTQHITRQAPRRGKLTAQEREQRQRDGLCLYCGNAGHVVANCPMTTNRPRPQQLSATSLVTTEQPDACSHLVLQARLDEPATTINIMIDSGATSNFIHQSLVDRLDLPQIKKDIPIPLEVIDGTPISSGKITHHTKPLRIQFQGHQEDLVFNIIPLGKYDAILGKPWLRFHNPRINWEEDSIVFDSPQCTKDCLVKIQDSTPKVELLQAACFATHLEEKDTLIAGTLSIDSASVPDSATGAEVAIPKELLEFEDLFAEELAKLLPQHKPWDHEIPLLPDKKPPYGPIYSLSETELKSLREYIADNLEKGFIRPSSSPAGSPILFVKKKDGSLRLCVDYRGLNAITVKNRYALPLIPELLDRLEGAKYFSKLDLRGAYNLVRIKKGEEWKTAFRTRYGHYEYQVMPFGLTNAPATFQALLNDVLRPFLDIFVVVYLDDILIFSKTREAHTTHLRQVLTALRLHNLFVKLEKCSFYQAAVAFLGYIISDRGTSVDPDKVKSLAEWPIPSNTTEVMAFLGFANFYRRFIQSYSQIAEPLTKLLKKEATTKPFQWNTHAEESFDSLRKALTTAPILRHFNANEPIIVETDASDMAIGGCLIQKDPEDQKEHPVAYYSRKLTSAEINYEVHDKELLAVVACLREWRVYTEGARHQVTVFSDHRNLTYFTTSKILNRRQARWSELLGSFDFVVIHRAGVLNTKADLLSRRSDYMAKSKESSEPLLQGRLIVAATDSETEDLHLPTRIKQAQLQDSICKSILVEIEGNEPAEYTKDYSVSDDGILLFANKTFVPSNKALRLEILESLHDEPSAGHLGRTKTLDLVSRYYYWPGIRSSVEEYVATCQTCSRNKKPRHKAHGLLQQIPLVERPWSSISLDFIVKLPQSRLYKMPMDSILVVVDCLTKMAHFVPCQESMDAEKLAQLFMREIFRLHGVPDSIISDRGTTFTAAFTSSLCKLLKIKHLRSTAYHPQTDGQTERVNQVLEQFLRIYVNYQQDNWVDLLPLAEFAYNNAKHVSINATPYYANYGYHPICNYASVTVASPKASDRVGYLRAIHQTLATEIKHAHAEHAKYYNATHAKISPYNVGDKVWLSTKNINTTRPTKKLDYKQIGPYVIKKRINPVTYELEIPEELRIHPVFHTSLLEPLSSRENPRFVEAPPPPIRILEGEVGILAGRVIRKITDSRQIHFKLEYLTHFADKQETPLWIPREALRSQEAILKRFHEEHPRKPGPNKIRGSTQREPRVHNIDRFLQGLKGSDRIPQIDRNPQRSDQDDSPRH